MVDLRIDLDQFAGAGDLLLGTALIVVVVVALWAEVLLFQNATMTGVTDPAHERLLGILDPAMSALINDLARRVIERLGDGRTPESELLALLARAEGDDRLPLIEVAREALLYAPDALPGIVAALEGLAGDDDPVVADAAKEALASRDAWS